MLVQTGKAFVDPSAMKRWEDNIREWTGLEFGKSQRAVENRENGENWLRNYLWCPSDPRG